MYLIVVVMRRKDDCEASRGLFGVWTSEATMALSEAGLARLPQALIPWHPLASLPDGTRLTHHPQGPQGLTRDQPLPHPPSPLSPDSDCSRTHSPPSVPKKAGVWGCLSCRCLSIGSLWRPPPSRELGLSDILQLPMGRPKLRPLLQLGALSDLRSGRLGLPNRRSIMKSDRETR